MQRSPFLDVSCSIAQSLNVIGEWWTLLILRDVFYGVRRFDALHEHLGISRKVLAERLRRLTNEKVLKKVSYQNKPTRFEYRLTRKGLDLLPILLSLMNWGDRWQSEQNQAPVVFLHTDCNHLMTPKLVCSHCNGSLNAGNIEPQPGPGAGEKEISRLQQASRNPNLFKSNQ